jgi:hypothetical protein
MALLGSRDVGTPEPARPQPSCGITSKHEAMSVSGDASFAVSGFVDDQPEARRASSAAETRTSTRGVGLEDRFDPVFSAD